jgi:hypothetical protein
MAFVGHGNERERGKKKKAFFSVVVVVTVIHVATDSVVYSLTGCVTDPVTTSITLDSHVICFSSFADASIGDWFHVSKRRKTWQERAY